MNLGYSNYISDEPGTFFYRGYGVDSHLSHWEFLLKQRKGPMQILVGFIPYTLVGNYSNEFAQRLPFALFSTGAIIIFYLLVYRLTSSKFAAFISAFLLATNGLIAGYGRVAQYQNLNLFFSFSALYFFSFLRDKGLPIKTYLVKSLLGSLMFCLSFLSHWDALYILIPILTLVVEYLLDKEQPDIAKAALIFSNIILVLLILSPFMIPYISYQKGSPANMEYLNSIVGLGLPFSKRPDLGQFKLYNPFFTIWFYLVFGAIGLLKAKKHYLFAIWFIAVFVIFRFFVNYSGLHFYNIFIPLVVLVGIGVEKVIKKSPRKLKIPITALITLFLAFFFYQSYLLFVDPTTEYPMESENILGLKTKKYEHSDNIRHRTGFPHKRYWKEINEFINEQNRLNGEDFGYITNEDRIDGFYMDAEKSSSGGYYAIGIKRPLSLQYDYKFPQIKNKETVHKIEDAEGNTVVRIYRIEP
ncbi:glycosyltransferase family 39 protein [Patescibacteria group bacterium]|nr:glycosyltransferase family 39 protein [Patescibacteria group bacterium]